MFIHNSLRTLKTEKKKNANIHLYDTVNAQDLHLRVLLHLRLQWGVCLIALPLNVLNEIHLFVSQIAKIYTQSQNAEKQLYGISIVEFRYGISNNLSLTCNRVKKKEKRYLYPSDSAINDNWRALDDIYY